jgi:hypothetical protein
MFRRRLLAIGDRQRRRRQRFVIIGVWSIGRTEHRDVGDRIDEATNSPGAGRFSTEARTYGPLLAPRGPNDGGAGGRNGRQCAAVMARRSPAPSTTKPCP